MTILGLPTRSGASGYQSNLSKLGIRRKIRGGHVLISRCTTPPTRPKCWITSRTTATFASLLRGVPIHADTPAQLETHWTARPSVDLGLGVEEAGWIADRKSITAILWPSSQRLRHRAKGRLSLGDPVGRTRCTPAPRVPPRHELQPCASDRCESKLCEMFTVGVCRPWSCSVHCRRAAYLRESRWRASGRSPR